MKRNRIKTIPRPKPSGRAREPHNWSVNVTAPTKVAEFYTAAGTRIHNEGYGVERYSDALPEALNEIGVDDADQILEASTTDASNEALRASTKDALSYVGDDVGTPIIVVGDKGFFGPVLTRIPRGEDAGKLWDGFSILVEYPAFAELKRARDGELDFS